MYWALWQAQIYPILFLQQPCGIDGIIPILEVSNLGFTLLSDRAEIQIQVGLTPLFPMRS